MAEQLCWKKDGSTLLFSGELDSETVQRLWKDRRQLMSDVHAIDLSDLSRVDTAGVALLIHLVALAKEQNGSVVLQGASDKLQTLVKLYNLPEGLLPAFAS